MAGTAKSIAESILEMMRPVLETELRREIDSRVEPAIRGAEAVKDSPRLAFTMEEAAESLGIGLSTLKRLIYSGQIESVKLPEGQRRLIPREAIVKWLRENAALEVPEYVGRGRI